MNFNWIWLALVAAITGLSALYLLTLSKKSRSKSTSVEEIN